jgi:hypothetical protein
MIRKKITLFANALREISEGATSSATFTTALPLLIKTRTPALREVEAASVRLLLGVTGRVTNNGTPLSLNVFLEEQDPTGTWRGLDGSTMTPVVTATTFEKLELCPYFGGVTAVAPFATTRRALLLPSSLRAVAKLQGSITATPGMTFYLQADLFSE